MKTRFVQTNYLVIFIIVLALSGCRQTTPADHSNVPVRELTGDEISRLPIGEIVRFPAIVVKGLASDCVEIFTADDFTKYEGDGKYAIASRLTDNAGLYEKLPGTFSGVVTGRMTVVRDNTDPTRFCGIVTGGVFEIISID